MLMVVEFRAQGLGVLEGVRKSDKIYSLQVCAIGKPGLTTACYSRTRSLQTGSFETQTVRNPAASQYGSLLSLNKVMGYSAGIVLHSPRTFMQHFGCGMWG